ncbi:MAG: hypothetical protein AB1503_04270 [Bacillota bacterium]
MAGHVRRALIAAVAAAFTFAVLWWAAVGLGWVRQDRPVARLLAARPDLVSHRLTWSGDMLQVEVLPAPGVDLPEFYASLHRQLQEALGNHPFALRVEDRRDATLQEAMRVMRLYIEEALVSGRFSWANDTVREIAARQGLEWARMGVDAGYVYVELRHGTAYLYEVIPRFKTP